MQAFAFEVSYKPNGIKLGLNPTVCTVEPTDSDLASKEVEKLMKQTKLSVDEWETKLQAETRNNKDAWAFDYIVIDDKSNVEVNQDCDITFVFEPKPSVAEKYFTLGISDYDAETQTSLITIYYLGIEECYHTEREVTQFTIGMKHAMVKTCVTRCKLMPWQNMNLAML